ncbi:MAG: twin-arginine translocase TatA/TatE family subunit [Geminicoccaceae bacterium]
MSFGIWEIAIILLVVLVFFGAGKLPAAMGDFAKGIKAFKGGLKDESETVEAAAAAPPVSQPAPEPRPAAPLLIEPAAQPDEARRA